MITLDGYPLLIPDADVATWIQDRLPLAADLFAAPAGPMGFASQVGSKANSFTENSIGIGQINWPLPPAAKLNTLWWPTGASRFARGVFLADRGTAEALSSSSTIKLLTISESINSPDDSGPGGHEFNAYVYLLSPRMISGPTGETLWALPLVDSRYFWQKQGAGDLTAGGTWGDLISALADSLGATVTYDTGEESSVNTDYLIPDWTELTRHEGSAAVLLDLAAESVGLRVVKSQGEQLFLQRPARASADATAKLAGLIENNFIMAGGESMAPAESWHSIVDVSFPYFRHGRRFAEGERLYAGNASDQLEFDIRSTCAADFSTDTETPDNLTKLDDLATLISADYLAWRALAYDVCFVGHLQGENAGGGKWIHNALDDYFELSVGSLDCQGEHQFQTRVRSRPFDVASDVQFSQDPDLVFLGKFQIAKIIDSEESESLLEEFGCDGLAKIWRSASDGTSSATSLEIPVKYWAELDPPIVDDRVELKWLAEENRWYAQKVQAAKPVYWGRCVRNWEYETDYPSNIVVDESPDPGVSNFPANAWVMVMPAADAHNTGGDTGFPGTVPEGGIKVWLHCSAGRDPNLVAGQIIAFSPAPGQADLECEGDDCEPAYVCVSDCSDDFIGAIKFTNRPKGEFLNLPPGWVDVSNSEGRYVRVSDDNAIPDAEVVGSGDDADDVSLGAMGGVREHSHGEAIDEGDPQGPGSTELAVTDIEIDNHSKGQIVDEVIGALNDHDDHVHATGLNIGAGFAIDLVNGTTTTDGVAAVGGGAPGADVLGHSKDGGYDPDAGFPISHTITEPNDGDGHKHVIVNQAVVPPYYAVRMIERIDNSYVAP